jgi:hypothetical protein
MFSLTICFGPSATSWALMFRTKENANEAWNRMTLASEGKTTLTDDFGQRGLIDLKSVHGLMLEDLDLTKQAHIQRALHHAHMQAEGQSAAMADPVLRAQGNRGPSILAPGGFPNGGMRSQ